MPRELARGLVLQPACRKTSLEVFWWAPERMLLLGALCHPHSLGMHTPALGRGYISFPFPTWETGRWVTAESFYCFPFCSTAKPHSVGKQLFRLQSQPTNSSGISAPHSSLVLQFTPHLPFTLSPLPKQVPQVTGNLTFLHHECAFRHWRFLIFFK